MAEVASDYMGAMSRAWRGSLEQHFSEVVRWFKLDVEERQQLSSAVSEIVHDSSAPLDKLSTNVLAAFIRLMDHVALMHDNKMEEMSRVVERAQEVQRSR